MHQRNFPLSGSINDLPQEIIDEFLDKVNHIKREGMWEKFKEVKVMYYTDIGLQMHYSEGNIICFKKLDDDEMIVYHIPYQKEESTKEGE